MDEQELREEVESRVGRPVSDDVWDFLRQRFGFHVEGAADIEALVATARHAMQLAEPVRRTKRRRKVAAAGSGTHFLEPRLLKREEARRDALTRYFARDAARHPSVQEFRSEVLDNRSLSPEQARAWLESPAVRMFPLDKFRSAGIRPGKHSASLVSHESTAKRYRACVRVNPGGQIWHYVEALHPPKEPWDAIAVDGSYTFSIKANVGWAQGRYRRRSVLHWLLSTAAKMAERGYGWDSESYPWFILTAQAPRALAVEGSWSLTTAATNRNASINLKIAPWMSANTVLAAYRNVQKDLLTGHNRPVSERRLALFRFVTDHTNDDGSIPPWHEIMARWNNGHRNWRYTDRRNFARDYWAVARLLLSPQYRFFK